MRSVGGGWSRSALTVMATATGVVQAHGRAKGGWRVTSSKGLGDRQRYPNIERLHCACQDCTGRAGPLDLASPRAGRRYMLMCGKFPPRLRTQLAADVSP